MDSGFGDDRLSKVQDGGKFVIIRNPGLCQCEDNNFFQFKVIYIYIYISQHFLIIINLCIVILYS